MKRYEPPINGWMPRSYYLVECCFSRGNPIFLTVFYTGFLSEQGYPDSGYSCFVNLEDQPHFRKAYYLKAVRLLWTEDDEEPTAQMFDDLPSYNEQTGYIKEESNAE